MLTLYDPRSETFGPSAGYQVTDPQLQVNILIELRVMNQLALELARGNFSIDLDGLRNDVVNDTANPIL